MSIAKNITFLVSGYPLADQLKSASPTADSAELDRTTLADEGYQRFEQSFKNATVELNGVFDSDTTNEDKIHDVLKDAFGTGDAKVVTSSFGLVSPGGPAYMLDGVQMKYSVPQNTGELIFANATFRSNNGMNFGKWLLKSQINAGTVNGTDVDEGAATNNGGLLHAHWSNDDATGLQIFLEDSADGVSWATLATILAGVRASGRYTFAANPAATDTITFNGVTYTFIAGASSGTDVQIKGSLALTLVELAAVLNASVNGSISIATYTSNATQIIVTVDAPGTGGNAYTLDTPTAGNVTRSGATLAGGADMTANEHGAQSVVLAKGSTVRRHTRTRVIVSGGDTFFVAAALARK